MLHTFFTVLLRHSLFENALQHIAYDTDEREKKTLVFATISTVSLLFCSQAFGAIASRPFLSNETTVCQRQQRRHTHTRDAKKTGKIAIIKSICKQEKKVKLAASSHKIIRK